eukprot:CAMPEP_0195133892 /NCGR_PEP_ID=MMETSP0448-20130528/149629_1 /TAXON_ID=66468 /ORGANISM="Heterocapsa triquestra, Strain CCMP 448" /LENGTH=47 /DNA_ID= /DNA_START= /DNA_END= /DNA_ORIENTATION=
MMLSKEQGALTEEVDWTPILARHCRRRASTLSSYAVFRARAPGLCSD